VLLFPAEGACPWTWHYYEPTKYLRQTNSRGFHKSLHICPWTTLWGFHPSFPCSKQTWHPTFPWSTSSPGLDMDKILISEKWIRSLLYKECNGWVCTNPSLHNCPMWVIYYSRPTKNDDIYVIAKWKVLKFGSGKLSNKFLT